MEILAILNKVLDIKAVQYLMLLIISVGAVSYGWTWIRYTKARYDLQACMVDYKETALNLDFQNQKIVQASKEFREKQNTILQASKEAIKITSATKKQLEEWDSVQLDGSCDESVKEGLLFLNKK